MAKITVGVRIEGTMKQKLDYIAENLCLSQPDLLRVALMDYIQKYEKEHGKLTPAKLNQLKLD